MEENADFARREGNLRNWLMSYVVESPDMRALYKERVVNLRMSASLLTSFVDIVYAGPMSVFENYILQAPRGPETEALVNGNLMHATFDAVTREGLSDEEAVEYYLKALKDYDTTEEMREKLRERGAESVLTTLAEFGEVVRKGKSEVSFAGEGLTVAGVPVTGKIDHIVVDEAVKTIEIYDYKTSAYKSAGWKSNPTLHNYMLQLIFYKMLLKASVKYRNYKVTRGHILFVMRDKKTDTVYDKVYDYNETDEQEFLQILRAVYKQVSSLSFMNDAELMITPDKSRVMKDVREFIALLLAKTVKK